MQPWWLASQNRYWDHCFFYWRIFALFPPENYGFNRPMQRIFHGKKMTQIRQILKKIKFKLPDSF